MPKAAALYWNKCRGDAWAPLMSVDLDDPHFAGFEGVFVIWHGGPSPQPVKVGQGDIRQRLLFHRSDEAVLAFQAFELFVAWARVERPLRDGIERFLSESLRPKVASAPPSAIAIEANLPGHKPAPGAVPAAAGPEPTQPGYGWEDLTKRSGPATLKASAVTIVDAPKPAPASTAPAAAEPPKVRRISRLQDGFDKLAAEYVKRKGVQTGGFFSGGAAKPTGEEERLVLDTFQMIMREAVAARASDIHMEPLEQFLRVRFRVDGIMEEVLRIPAALNIRAVSHIRVACGLDPERGIGTAKPEDGRMGVTIDGQDADMRLSTFPTAQGDKAVLRIIPRTTIVPKLGEVGFRPETVKHIEELINRPQGMIIVTGPTGSGKSTTLYTMLQELNDTRRNIVTLEDPIEKKIPGVTQGMIQPKAGFTFASGLRAILRQDPNIIMVGEIRDVETAEIALSAALTGHMLFTTLHTNSALGSITRLLDMGLEPFLISSSLTAVMAQRLARRICEKCREEAAPSAQDVEQHADLCARAMLHEPPPVKVFRGKGCADCRESGYRGRVVVFELVRITPSIRQLILRKAPQQDMQGAAVADRSQTLLSDGLSKVAEGITTIAEVVRVAGLGD